MKDIWHGQDRRMMMMMMMVMMMMMMMIMMKNDDDADDADDDDDDDDDRCLWVYLHFLKRYINQCLQIHVIYIYTSRAYMYKKIYIYTFEYSNTHMRIHIYIYTYSGINLKNDHRFFRLFHEFLRFDIVCPKVPSLKLTLRMKSYSLSHTTSVFTS